MLRHLKLIIGLAIFAGIIYFGYKLIPPYFENYQLQDAIDNEALLNTYTQKTEGEIRDTVIRKAQELNIPLDSSQITVQRSYNYVQIQADYTVHIDLPYYPLDLKFHAASKNKGI